MSNPSFTQDIAEKEVNTAVNEVTVFLNGAQILRKKSVELQQGKTILKFSNLSPFIDAKSVQVKANGEVTILSVHHQQNFLDKLEKSQELTGLENKLQKIKEQLVFENTHLEILREELAFLQEYRDLGGRNQELSVTNLKEASDFYHLSLTDLKLKEIERNKTISELTEKQNNIQSQIQSMTSSRDYPNGEILVKVDARRTATISFELSYMVGNAGWFPSYDIRAKNVNEPVELIYKANVKQDSKIDWTNVRIKFSSSDPNVSGVAPELQTYFLSYNTLPPVYDKVHGIVSGKIRDANQVPLPGANILVEGTTIGTVSDMDGNYSITIPSNASHLTFSFIGYQTQTLPISSSLMNINLQEDLTSLEEVVVIGYGTDYESSVSQTLQGRASGVSSKRESELKIRGSSSIVIPTARIERQTVVDFEINTPYTVKSDNKSYSVDMEVYRLPSFYRYYSVPKIKKDAFLIANIIDWEKYNLLEGEANIFFEETYIGKTLLDVRYASDTLQISLGRDKSVAVNREKIKDYTTKQFLGNKKEETRGWRIIVKNNKSQKIDMIILDQVPVSTTEEIEIDVQQVTGAKQLKETGEIKWEFSLEPNESKEFELIYSVKYPKYRNLIIE
jgi:hypothetical protein